MQEGGNLVSRASQVSEAWLREAGQSQYPEGLRWGFASCLANQTFHAPQAPTHAMGLLASGEEIDADPAAFSFCARSTAG